MWKRLGSIARLIGSIALACMVSAAITTIALSIGAWLRSIDPSLTNVVLDIPGLMLEIAALCAPFALPIILTLESTRVRAFWAYGLCGAVVPLLVLALLLPHTFFSLDHFLMNVPDYFTFVGTGFVSGAAYRLVRRATYDPMQAQGSISAPSGAPP